MAEENNGVIQAKVEVGLLGGESITSGSGLNIKKELTSILNQLEDLSFKLNINPIVSPESINTMQEAVQEKINKQGIKVQVGAEIGDVKQTRTSSERVASPNPVKEKEAPAIKESAPAPKVEKKPVSSEAFSEADIAASVKEFLDTNNKALKKKISEFVGDVEKIFGSISGMEDPEEMKRSLSGVQENVEAIIRAGNKFSYVSPEGDNDHSAEFVTMRNERVNTQEYLLPLQKAIALLETRLKDIKTPRKNANISAYEENFNKFREMILPFVQAVDSKYNTGLNDAVLAQKITMPPALVDAFKNSKGSSGSNTSGSVSSVDAKALADALSKIKIDGIDNTAIKSIDTNVKAIKDSVSAITTARDSGINNSDNVQTGTSASASPANEMPGGNDYSAVLERIASGVEGLKNQTLNINAEDIQNLVKNIQPSADSGAAQNPGNSGLALGSEFESALISTVSTALADGFKTIAPNGDGIRSAITEALVNFPGATVSQESINTLVEAIRGISLPEPVVNVEPPAVIYGGRDYTDVLEEIKNRIDTSAVPVQSPDQRVKFKDGSQKDDKKAALSTSQSVYSELEKSIKALGNTYHDWSEAVANGNDDAQNEILSQQNALRATIQSLKAKISGEGLGNDKLEKRIAKAEQSAEHERTQSISKKYSDVINERFSLFEELAKAGENIDQKKVDDSVKKINSLSEMLSRLSGIDPDLKYAPEVDLMGENDSTLDSLMDRYTDLKRERERQAAAKALSDYGSVEAKNAEAEISRIDKSLGALEYSISSVADNAGRFDEFADKVKNTNTAVNAEGVAFRNAVKASRELADAQDKLNDIDTINNTNDAADALRELNDRTAEYSSSVNEMRSKGGYDFWSQAFKEDAGVTPGLDKSTEKSLKDLVNKRIKAQENINKSEITKIKAAPDSEEYATAVRDIADLNKRVGELDAAISNLQPLYPELFKSEASQLAELNTQFEKQRNVAREQVRVYGELRAAVTKLGEAQRNLDNANASGDTTTAEIARGQVDAANSDIERHREYSRANNLTDKKFEHDIEDTQNREEFKRLSEITQEYYDNKIKLIRLGTTENAEMTEEYKRVQALVNAYKELKDSVRSGINDSEFRSNGRFYNIQNQEDTLKKQVTLETNRAKALQTIYKWQTKNSKAADEYGDRLANIVSALNSPDITEEGINNYKMAYENVVAEATARGIIGRNETEAELKANSASAKALMQRYQDLLAKADAKAFKDFESEIGTTKSAISDAEKFGTNETLKNARRQLSELTTEFKTAGYAGGNMFTSLDKKIRGLGQLFVSGSVVGQIKQQLSGAADSVINLDSAFANIRMTMEMSNEEMHKLGDQSISLAKELGTSLESITQAATIYANQNITTEEIMNRAKPTALLATAAEMSSSASADLIQGAMYQFELDDTVDNLNRIVDVVEKVSASTGVEFKRSIEQISEGIQTTGAMAHEAGYSVEQYTALIGGLVEKTRRSGSELANSVKMIFARLGQNKEGDATDEEISQAEKAYKSIGINLRDGADSFRDIPEVFDELNEKWKTMTDVQKSYIAEISAGNRNRSVFMAMMNGYDSIAKLTDDAMNSEGYAEQANEARMESFEAKYGQLKAAAQGFWNNFTDSEAMKKIVDLATGLVSLLDNLINKSGVLSSAIKGLMVAFAAKSIPNFVKEMSQSDSTIGMVIRTIKSAIPNIKAYNEAVNNFASVDKSDFNSVFEAFKGDGSLNTKKMLAKMVGIDDDTIQKAVDAVESGLDGIADEVSLDIPVSADFDSDNLGDFRDVLKEITDSAEAESGSLQDWADQIEDTLDSISEISFDENGVSANQGSDLQGWTDLVDANDALGESSQRCAEAEAAEAVATNQSSVANAAETTTLRANTSATQEQAGAETQRAAAGAVGTVGDMAHAAAQVTLRQRIKLATQGILAQAAAWAATPVGMFTIITTAVGAIAGGMSLLKQKSEEAKQKIEETFEAATTAVQEYREGMQKLDDSEDKVVELSNKYRQLSKGVSENGYRVSLTREQYEEYKDVVSQIVNLNDALVTGHNTENLALLDLGETVDETRKKYQELAKEQSRTFVSENKDTILEANKNLYHNGLLGLQNLDIDETQTADVLRVWKKHLLNRAELGKEYYKRPEYKEYKKEMSTFSSDAPSIMYRAAKELGFNSSTAFENAVISGEVKNFEEDLDNVISDAESKIAQNRNNVNNIILAEMQVYDSFYKLNAEQKEFIDAVLGNLQENDNFYKKIADDEISTKSFVTFLLDTLSGDKSVKLADKKAIIDKQYDEGLLTISEYKNKMSLLKKEAVNAVGDSEFGEIFTGQFNTDEAEAARAEAITGLKDSFAELATVLDPEEYKRLLKVANVEAFFNSTMEELEQSGLLDGFTTDDIEVMARLDIKPEWNEDELREEIKTEKLRMRNIARSEFNFLDSSYKTDIENFATAIGKLKTAMQSVETLSSDDLLELMMAFNTFDWASFGVTGEEGVGNVSGAIKALVDKSLADLKDAFGDVGAEQIKVFSDMADDAKKATTKIDSLSDAMNGLSSMYSALKAVQEEMSKYGRVSIGTVADLIDSYPDLAGAGAQYISGQISGDEFMAEFNKSYDKVYKEREQYIYDKALEDPEVKKKYDEYIAKKNAEAGIVPAEQTQATFWKDFKDAYDIDLDNYATYAEAKADIEKKLTTEYSELLDKYSKYYDTKSNTIDSGAMAQAGYSGQEIAYAQSLVAKLEGKKQVAETIFDKIEGYYETSAITCADTIKDIADTYDVDISNCRSYASAKAKIFARLLKINKGFLSYMGDDAREVQIINDLIDDKGNFNGVKAKTYYGLDQQSMEKLLEIANVIRKVNNQIEELENIDLDKIDTGFFNEIDLSDPAEQLELINSLLSEMLSLYDQVFAGIKVVADERVETLEKEKEALEDKNDEENREIELIRARQQLEDAKRNKNIRVYHEGKGFVWEADKKAIQEAEENLKDKETDAQVAEINKQIDAINDYTDSIDKIADSVNNEKAISAAMKRFGVTDPDKLLELSDETLKSVQNNYRNLTIENDKADNAENLTKYVALTDEQIRERFGSNFGMSLDSLRDYWSGAYFVPNTIKEFVETEKKAMQAVEVNKQASTVNDNKNYYIENININYSGDSFDEILKEATRISKTR